MLKLFTISTLVLLLASVASADIPRPDGTPASKKPKAVDTYLSIQLDRNAKEARLIIPRSQMKTLKAELDSIGSGSDDAVTPQAGSFSRLQMIVSGTFMSLAVVFAGIWFTRRRGSPSGVGKSAAAAMVVFACGALATIVYGNAGPPADARSITGKMFAPAVHVYKFGGGKIKLEVSDAETQPKLIVPDPDAKPSE